MTRDEIIKLAREAGLTTGVHISGATSGVTLVGAPSGVKIAHITIDDFERFAALVAAKEREDILRMSESQFFKTQAEYDDAIRARGNK
jgi:phosphoribosylcarboxyaminoimidazole (NCAIR) mutase